MSLADKRVLFFAGPLYEDLELWYPKIRLEEEGASTTVAGTGERVLELAGKMHQAPFAQGAQRVVTTIKIDDRRDKPLTIEGKVKAVVERMR